MKKILSVVLAGAMILGMSVSAFADKSWGANSNDTAKVSVTELSFGKKMMVVPVEGSSYGVNAGKETTLRPGDDMYFAIMQGDDQYTGNIDKNWSINIKGNSYVAEASFYTVPDQKADGSVKTPWGKKVDDTLEGAKYVKVSVQDDLDEVDSEEVSFKLYLADNKVFDARTENITVDYKFANMGERKVDFVGTNDADQALIWKVAKDDKGTATFDFSDDVYYTVKMISEEKVVLNLSTAYDKAIDKEYNEYDADLSFYNFKGSKDSFTKTGELFIPADKDSYIYEIVDGELVEVDAEYNDAYKVAGISKKYKGFVINTKELGYYVVADDELVVAEDDTTDAAEEEKPSTDKQNPAMGANDFVGAAVALAVVSVAAAGALALKK